MPHVFFLCTGIGFIHNDNKCAWVTGIGLGQPCVVCKQTLHSRPISNANRCSFHSMFVLVYSGEVLLKQKRLETKLMMPLAQLLNPAVIIYELDLPKDLLLIATHPATTP